MGQVLHGSARTTEAVRRAIQHSQESLRALAKRHGVNQKTIAKWRKRSSVCDQRTGPKEPRSTVASGPSNWIFETVIERALLALSSCGGASERTTSVATRSTSSRAPSSPPSTSPQSCSGSNDDRPWRSTGARGKVTPYSEAIPSP